MVSPFESTDRIISNLTAGKVVNKIKHIDDDGCIQITFSDGSCIVLEGMLDKTARSGAIPTLHHYDSDGEIVPYLENGFVVS